MGMGLIQCTHDSDCGSGQTCHLGAQPCQNQCVAKASGCATDADCGKCTFCISGQCEGTGLSMCQTDGDCAANQVCQIGDCGNLCVAMPTDAGPADTSSPADSAQPKDSAQTETTAVDTAAPDATQLDASTDVQMDSGSSDAACPACDAGLDAAGADVPDAAVADTADATGGDAAAGGAVSAPTKSGCAASRTADAPWAVLLALAAAAIVRRRQRA